LGAPLLATLESTHTPKSADSLGDRVRSLRMPAEPESAMLDRKNLGVAGVLLFAALGLAAYWYTGGEEPLDDPEEQVAVAEPAKTFAGTETGSTNSAAPQDLASPIEKTSALLPAEPAPLAPAAAPGEVVLQSTGYVVPAHQLLISPKVSGMITALNIEEGQRVKQGEVLAELESVDYKADVARARAMLEATRHKLLELERGSRPEEIGAAKAELAEAVAQRDQLLSQWKRTRSLRANKTVTENDYEQAESNYKATDRKVNRLENNLKLMVDGPRVERIDVAKAERDQAEADLQKAEWRLGNCTIVAPISGTILKKNAEIGNVVNPVAFNGSFSLCEMADLSDLEVDLSIQERSDLARVHKGQKCKIRAEAFPDRIYDGYVSRLMPIADRAKGAVPVRVKLSVPANEEGVYLKPEMSAVVSFLKDSQ
jgi:HlyD family secretion protein